MPIPKAEENNEYSVTTGKQWVVLVAGSRGWSNYRHQVYDLNNLNFTLFLISKFISHYIFYCIL